MNRNGVRSLSLQGLDFHGEAVETLSLPSTLW